MKSKQQTCLLLLNYFLYVCVYEGFVIKLQKKAGSTELSTKKKKRDFLHQKEID